MTVFMTHESATGIQETVVMNAGVSLDPFENGNIAAGLQRIPEKNSPTKTTVLHSTDIGAHIPQVLDKVNSLMSMMSSQANEIKVSLFFS